MKKVAANQFNEGLNLDLHPIVTPNSVLTDNLNGTLITYNGNEFCLQNDRGNSWVCDLTKGYVPIGIKEYNGIIYIVSVNEDKTEIGSFPSPGYTNNPTILEYNYKPLNVIKDSSIIKGFTDIPGLGYSVNNPVTIEVQPSYDGSVNLILTAEDVPPRIINTRFSVEPNDKCKIIERNQSVETNLYELDNISDQLKLIRVNNTITNVDLENVQSGGQFKGGNYTFYIKFGDADYNQTDVVAESGIVSVFNGNDGVPSTISGTLLDERTDKMIQLKISGLNHIYSKIYIYYSREYSDTLGYRMTEAGMFQEPIDMEKGDTQTIWLTGYETTIPIDINELNVDYHTIDFAKAQAQQANMLFLGNVGQSETFDLYKELKEITLKNVITSIGLGDSITPVSNDFTDGKDYYSTKNIYYKLGYWPDEIYRFGIVYILKDGSTTPVFNMTGGKFETSSSSIKYPENGFNSTSGPNEYGVFRTPRVDVLSNSTPMYFHFKFTESLPEQVIGWFVVRQKRIPMTICQGLRIGIDKRSHLPITWNGKNWITQSFLSVNRDWNINEKGEYVNFEKRPLPTEHVLYPMLEYDGATAQTTATKKYSPETIDYLISARSVTYDGTYPYVGNNIVCRDKEYYLNLCQNEPVYHLSDQNDVLNFYDNGGEYACVVIYKVKLSHKSNKTEFVSIDNQYIYFVELQKTFNTIPPSLPTDIGLFTIADDVYYIGTPEDIETLSEREDKKLFGNIQKLIVYKHPDTSLKGYGLLSLEPFVNNQIGTLLDGSKFKIRREYTTTESFGKEDQYASGTNANGNYLLLEEDINAFVENESYEQKIKCVSVPQNTGVKVIDDFAFSTVAGSASEAGDFKYAAESLGIYVDNRSNWLGAMKPTGDYRIHPSTEIGADNEVIGTEDYKGFNSTHNVNLIRGNFTPFVGLATDNLSHGIYSIRTPEIGDTNAFIVRENDNSEYYTVSKRFDLSKNQLDEKVYGGDCYFCTVAQRVITNFIDNTAPVSTVIVDPGSWEINVRRMSRYGGDGEGKDADDKAEVVDYTKVNISDVNTVDLGYWVSYKCLSSYNLGLRSVDSSHSDEYALMGSPRSFYPLNGCSTATGNKMQESYLLNDGLSATVGRKRYILMPDVPYTKSEFANRIMFSNVHMTDAYTNGYRTFQGVSYRDYDKQYGEITKLISLGQNILIIMEHGIGLIPVNERALMQTTTGEAIHIYGAGVLPEQMSIISQDFGSKYEESVVRTPIGVYGIDTSAKKIWRVTDKHGFETISDMKIESLLNDTLNPEYEIEMPEVDVRTHYNIFKGDLMFTWNSKLGGFINICFNERLNNLWVTRYDWRPIISENKNGDFFSLKESGDRVSIWEHTTKSNPTNWYGQQKEFEFEFVVSEPIGVNKIFDNLEIISNNVQPKEMEITVIGDDYMFKRDLANAADVEEIRKEYNHNAETTSNIHAITNTRFNESDFIPVHVRAVEQTALKKVQEFKDIYKYGRRIGNIQYKEGLWYTVIEPALYRNKQVRIRDKWTKIRIRYTGKDLAVITAVRTMINV